MTEEGHKPVASSSGYRISEIPHFVQYVSPVARPATFSTSTLPLGIIVLIFSYLDDAGDLARVTRTSRLFRYVALPQLYQKVSLQARAEIKYVDGRPQGFGGGSPFAMALNGLATQDYTPFVKELHISGDLDEPHYEDFAKGRVPDTTMMLNTLLRLVVERASRLESFIWELNAKPANTLYSGLASSQTLTKLTLRYPNTRLPQPTTLVPGMPKLRLLKVINIDPMCYPDDLSLLLLHSRALEDLRLYFSPRMRFEAEPMVMLQEMFRRCTSAGYAVKLKHFAIQNYFGRYFDDMQKLVDLETTKSISFLDMFGGSRTRGPNVYIDDSWRVLPPDVVSTHTSLRFNEPASQHVKMLAKATEGLVKFYFVNDLIKPAQSLPDTPETSPGSEQEIITLGKEYVHVLTRKHGPTLKHLLLCDQWSLSQLEIGDIVRCCPKLEQLAIALEDSAMEVFRIVIQFLPNLYAIRVFDNDILRRERMEIPLEERIIEVARLIHRPSFSNLRYLGAGPEVFRIDGTSEIMLENGSEETIANLVAVSADEIQHVAIWGMNRVDIIQERSHVT